MNENFKRSHKIRNIVCIGLSVLAAAGLIYLWLQNQREEQEREAVLEEIAEEILTSEEELRDVQKELADVQASISYTSDTAKLMIGFIVSESRDYEYIASLEEVYGFSPVVVLDCSEDIDTLEERVDFLEDYNWEIMLGARSFSEEANETALALRETFSEAERTDTGVFFLRENDYSISNIETLIQDGFIGYTKYNDSPVDGSTDEGIVYFDYTNIQTSEYSPSSRLADVYEGLTSMLVLFDMEALQTGAITETYIGQVMELTQYYAGLDACTYASVADVVAELSQINEIEAQRLKDREEEITELEDQIRELKEKINELYDRERTK
ncbi:MAG: hypothetical protein LUF78_13310 [Clostridiales bacterium]|nr:hypothetical protein [Clostridiales bacterium]